MRTFIEDILKEDYNDEYKSVYENSPLIQYIDKKTGSIDGGSKTRRSYGNIYAIYAVCHFYIEKGFFNKKEEYKKYEGFDYNDLWMFCKAQYGGSKLQNHALNNRLNAEFVNKIKGADKELLIINGSKYLLHVDYIYVNGKDITKSVKKIIEKYVELLKYKDFKLSHDLEELSTLKNINEKKKKLETLIEEDSEARIFEIISYAILKNHYKNQYIYIGESLAKIHKQSLELYKTGRTNANDGGIDFVMRPIGRFFQVTEVDNFDKYLLDIDKVLHFPITFVVKTNDKKEKVIDNFNQYITEKSGGMEVIIKKYINSIEEVITINELKCWLCDLNDQSIANLISDIELYYKLELNIEEEEE